MLKRRSHHKRIISLIITVCMLITLSGTTFAAPPEHSSAGGNPPEHSNAGGSWIPEVESRIKPIIKIGQREFRDLDSDGVLDAYEDWRLPVEERVADLVSKMTLEEKAWLMIINTNRMTENPTGADNWDYVTGSNETMIKNGMRYVIFRQTPLADELAKYTNQLQEIAEDSRLGIPVTVTSNPRNHASVNYTDISEEAGQHSYWPTQLGFAATQDPSIALVFAEIAREEWRAVGIHKIYGYMADVATDPLWSRIEETFGENTQLTADIIRNLVIGFQGEKLGADSVALTVKHFPGGGARYKGLDPHYAAGAFNIYPTEGSLLKYHIPPFQAAIDAGVSSIMPYYSYPSNDSADQGLDCGWYSETEQFEEIANALNTQILQGLLRDQLGFKGYVNSDTGAVGRNAWGAEGLTDLQKMAKALNAGTNIISGSSNPSLILQAVNAGMVPVEKIDESVTFLVTESMTLGLFEDPYVDPEQAMEVFTDPEHQEKANEAHLKSVVLLRNDTVDGQKVLPLKDDMMGDVKLYIEVFSNETGKNAAETDALKQEFKNYDRSITIVDTLEEATHAFVSVRPVQTLWGEMATINVGPETGIEAEEIARINLIQTTVPTITEFTFTSPFLIEAVERNAAAVIGNFGTKTPAVIDVIRGRYNPAGKLPFTLPANEEVIASGFGDIPDTEDVRLNPAYVYTADTGEKYLYGHGLSYEDQ